MHGDTFPHKKDTSYTSLILTSYLINYNLDSMDWSMDYVCVGDFLNESEILTQIPSFQSKLYR